MTRLTKILVLVLALLMPTGIFAQDEGLTKKERRQLIRESRKMLKSALQCIDQSECDSAQILVDSILKLDASNPDAHYYSGRLNLIRGDTIGAMQILTLGVSRAPRSARLKILLARLKLATGDVAGSMELSEAVLGINPRKAEALYLKGLGLMAQGDTLAAVDVLNEAAQIALIKKE